MADETAAPRSRRALLTGAAATAAALAASAALPLSVSAADPDDVVKGEDNATTTTTSVSNTGAGIGILGSSTVAGGVAGWSIAPPDPEWFSEEVTAYTGVFGSSPADPISALGTGVWGDSDDVGVFGFGGAGVYGVGDYGVIGESISTSPGVLAIGQSASDVALEVQGKVKFSRSGRATLGAGRSNIRVNLAGVTSSSRVFAVLHSNRTGRWVQSVIPTTGYFTVYLNGTVASSTYIAWFVIN
jgi:hypothetical protein